MPTISSKLKFVATLFTIAKTWKQPVNRGMDKEDMVHIYNGILAIKRDGTESFVVMWMNLESVIQSEESQIKRNKHCLYCSWAPVSSPFLTFQPLPPTPFQRFDCITDGFPDSSVGKESTCNAGDPGLIPGLGISPGEGIGYPLQYSWASLVAQLVKNLPAMWETWVRSWVGKIPLEKGKATHSSNLAWRIPWTVQSMGSQRVRQDWATVTSHT